MFQHSPPIVIVGTGLAGYGLLRAIRRKDAGRDITLVSADDGAAYSRAQFPFGMSGSKDAGELVLASAEQMAHRFDAVVRTRTRVLRIERNDRLLITERGKLSFGALVLACGAEPLRPSNLRGSAREQVLTLGSLDEYRYFRHELAGRRHVVILGGGVVGCEFADNLRRAGRSVTLFEAGTRLLGDRLPALCAARLAGSLADAGVRVMLEDGLIRVDQGPDDLELTTLSGARLSADLVIAVLGNRSRTQLAREAGLASRRGITVDAGLATNDPNIFAIGECVELGGRLFYLPEDIEASCRILADNLCGGSARMRWKPRLHRLQLEACPVVLCEPPPVAGEWLETATPRGVKASFHDRSGDLRGFALVGDTVDQTEAWSKRVLG
ncbi:NAD(P)/FAD-dependent oxidoreductase [Rhodocyclaceae bacterium SMB388]